MVHGVDGLGSLVALHRHDKQAADTLKWVPLLPNTTLVSASANGNTNLEQDKDVGSWDAHVSGVHVVDTRTGDVVNRARH